MKVSTISKEGHSKEVAGSLAKYWRDLQDSIDHKFVQFFFARFSSSQVHFFLAV